MSASDVASTIATGDALTSGHTAKLENDKDIEVVLRKDIHSFSRLDSRQSIESWLCSASADCSGKLGCLGEEGAEDIMDGFSLWLSDKVGGENETLRSATYIVSTVAVLEAAEHLLCIGSGFSKIDPTAFTLHQIKKIVERIERKVDVLINNPLKMCITYIGTLKTQILNEENQFAYETAAKLLDKAIEALHNTKTGSVDGYRQRIEATRFIIFATILKYCYCADKQVFYPSISLPSKRLKSLVNEVENWLEHCMKHKSQVRTKKFLMINSKTKKSQVQDLLDSILKTTYPIISEARGWTSPRTQIRGDTLSVQVMPEYLPHGYEDYTECLVGVRGEGETRSVVRLQLWRNRDTVFASCDGTNKLEMMIDPGEEIMRMSVSLEGRSVREYVISGDEGWYLGQYLYDPEHDCLKQCMTGTERVVSSGCRYLYQVDRSWYVGEKPGESRGEKIILKNTTQEEGDRDHVPRRGWKVRKESGKWSENTQVRVTPGHLTPCDSVVVEGGGEGVLLHPDCLGVFTRTSMWRYGRPVLTNNHGKLLYNDGGWRIGSCLGKWVFYTSNAPVCPADSEGRWFSEVGMYGSVDITVKCNTNH